MASYRMTALAAAAGWLVAGAAQAQFANDTVKIGVLSDMSSLYADIGGPGSVIAAQMAVKDFGGTVAGKPIEIVSADHLNKPDVGANIARQWIDQDHVDAIVDVPTSSVALAVQEVTKEKERIFLMSGPASSDLTGKACSPTGVHWTYDTYALAHGTGGALVKQGGDTWFFITADYAFGHALERDTSAVVTAAGGKVLGAVRAPLNTADFSSFLLQAQSSKAKIIGLANAGGDTINSIKQGAEFGIVAGGQRFAGLLVFISDVNSLGLQTAQGLVLTSAFYWDQNDETRAWSKRFMAEAKKVPTMVQAGVYGEVTHYLKAIAAAKTDDAKAVMAKMRELPINDFMTKNGKLREDGRVMRDMFLFQVKAPGESKYQYDDYKQLAVIPAEQAFRPLSESECPLVKKG
ncbi:MAG: ABC transporter substrate-binding protein [Alphaproteobacteria bacterium]|nr:ABC transporter substrate-binding protein [Alphaproteobacteria bacterium]